MQAAVWAVHVVIYLGAVLIWPPGHSGFASVVGVALVWASVTDWDRQEIPDAASALLVLSGTAWWLRQSTAPGFADAVAGAVLWPLVAWGVGEAYARLRGQQGLGLGDVKLLAGIGLWAGLQGTVWVVLCAALAGIGTILARAALRRDHDLGTQAIAFGPFLCLSAWAVVLQAGRV